MNLWVCTPQLAIIRLVLIVMAALAIGWGGTLFPLFWSQDSLEQVSRSILAGVSYQQTVLDDLAAVADRVDAWSPGSPAALRASAIIRLRIAESAITLGQRTAIDADFDRLRHAIERSLTAAPTDGFLWVALYWLSNVQNGFRPEHLKLLRMSYLMSPREGWVALKRNRLSLAVFSALPSDLRDRAIDEFAGLVVSGLRRPAAEILIGPGWRVRDVLLARLADLSDAQRQEFARTLRELGSDARVPGVTSPSLRPWQ
jgi:hypothetical protein